ncbi:ParB N-terminal domain-containing protein [Roseibium sp. Sym1]|uniref:ParB N-terminal domain-containing protein n=1 Tax=Roseibium sp. Sym1 TaxID=3016006 RepID=UPI0022B47922|nr:ParB N-terminal domain-containing protein [Roseibium sp. Sym1]
MRVYQPIKLSQIDIPEDRIREVDQDWAECLRDMFKEMGQKTPIDVVENGKRYTLVAGAHRFTAAKLARWREINARVLEPSSEHSADEIRLHEILENLGRKNFNALERCEALSELKRVYEDLHPSARRGGDRKSQRFKNKDENQMAIFAFCKNAAETTGLSERSIRFAVQVFDALSPTTRERLKGTQFAEVQADLRALGRLDPEIQGKVMDLVTGDEPEAATIKDALTLLDGGRPETETDRVFRRTINGFSKLPRASRRILFRLHKQEIIEIVKSERWLSGTNWRG